MAQRQALQEIATETFLPRTDHVSNVIIDLPLTPISPDEELIRLRGRYKPSAVTQSTITKTIDEVQLTPKKTPGKSQRKSKTPQKFTPSKTPSVPSRTSPRKRLNLQDAFQKCFISSNSSFSSIKTKISNKRMKFQSIKKLNNIEITQQLSTLSHSQLVDLMKMLILKHPELNDSLEDAIPLPDLSPLEENLNILQRNIFRSIPSTRWESNRDSFCFRRTSSHLQAFKKECMEQSGKFLQYEQWETALDYVLIAWRFVSTLPDWDNPAHNKVKIQCFKALASVCLTSIKKANFEEDKTTQLIQRLSILVDEYKFLCPCVKYLKEFNSTPM